MPYYADQRADLERQLQVLDPELTLVEPEDPAFPEFLGRVTALDANLARNIDKAVVDKQAEEARDLFGTASKKGNAGTVLANVVNKTKGKSVRGERRVRPVTFMAAIGGLLLLAVVGTALIPEKANAEEVPQQTASADTQEEATTSAEEVPTTPLPESTEDAAAQASPEEEAAPPITPAPTAEVSEPAPAPEPAPVTAVTPTPVSEPVSMPAPTPVPPAPIEPVSPAPVSVPEPAPVPAAAPAPVTRPPAADPIPVPPPLTAPKNTAPVRITPAPARTATTSNTAPTPISVPPPAAAPVAAPRAFASTNPQAEVKPPAATPRAAVVSGTGKPPQDAASQTPPRAVVSTAANGGAATPRTALSSAAPANAAAAPRTGLVAGQGSGAAPASTTRAGLVSSQGTSGAQATTRHGVVSSAGQGGSAQATGLASSGNSSTGARGLSGSGAGTAAAGARAEATSAVSGLVQASQQGASSPYTPGTVVTAELTTAVAVYPGAAHPVWARAEDGSMWRGTAALDEKTGRVVLNFTAVMQGGQQFPVLAYAESGDGPGIGGRVKQATPNAARAAVNGLLTGVRTFAESQAARTTTVTPTGVVSTSERPQNFWLAVGGALANAFVVPETRATMVPLGQIAVGERLALRVDLLETRS